MKNKLTAILLSMITVVVLLTGCGSSSKDYTMDQIIKVVEEKTGETIDKDEKPMYDLIGAKDGVIFYVDNSPVKIYEYESEKDLEAAKKEYKDTIENWPNKGKVLLETSNKEIIEIFNGIE